MRRGVGLRHAREQQSVVALEGAHPGADVAAGGEREAWIAKEIGPHEVGRAGALADHHDVAADEIECAADDDAGLVVEADVEEAWLAAGALALAVTGVAGGAGVAIAAGQGERDVAAGALPAAEIFGAGVAVVAERLEVGAHARCIARAGLGAGAVVVARQAGQLGLAGTDALVDVAEWRGARSAVTCAGVELASANPAAIALVLDGAELAVVAHLACGLEHRLADRGCSAGRRAAGLGAGVAVAWAGDDRPGAARACFADVRAGATVVVGVARGAVGGGGDDAGAHVVAAGLLARRELQADGGADLALGGDAEHARAGIADRLFAGCSPDRGEAAGAGGASGTEIAGTVWSAAVGLPAVAVDL